MDHTPLEQLQILLRAAQLYLQAPDRGVVTLAAFLAHRLDQFVGPRCDLSQHRCQPLYALVLDDIHHFVVLVGLGDRAAGQPGVEQTPFRA